MAFPSSIRLEQAIFRVNNEGISAASLALVAGLKPNILSNYVRGLRGVSSDVEQRVVDTSLLIASLAESIRPLELPNDATRLRVLLTYVKEHNITPAQIRSAIDSVFGVSNAVEDLAVIG